MQSMTQYNCESPITALSLTHRQNSSIWQSCLVKPRPWAKSAVEHLASEVRLSFLRLNTSTNTNTMALTLTVTHSYFLFVIFFTHTKFLENKIYTEKTCKLRQNTQKIAKFLRYYGKIHSKLPIFRVKSVKIYTGQKKFTREFSWLS